MLDRSLRRLLLSGVLLLGLVPTTAQASVILFPGYTDTAVGTVVNGVGNSYGSIAQSANGTLYVTGGLTNTIFAAAPGGPFAPLFTGSSYSLGLLVDGNTLYEGFDNGTILKRDLTTNATTPLTTLGSSAMDIALAPAGFGPYGGQLIVSTASGLRAVNPITGTSTTILGSGFFSAIEFTLDGRLLAANYGGTGVSEVAANGTVTPYATGVPNVDGLAVNPVTGQVFAGASGAQQGIFMLVGGAFVPFANDFTVDGGYYPMPLTFSTDGSSLFYGTNESGSYRIREIDGFAPAATPVPEPASLLLLGTGLGGVVARYRRRIAR